MNPRTDYRSSALEAALPEWGEPIEVDGVRPDWLRDDVMVKDCDPGKATHNVVRVAMHWDWQKVKAIRLPASHPHYHKPTLPEGFKPWHGGDTAPDDWDGGDVLRRGDPAYRIRPCSWLAPYEDNQRWTWENGHLAFADIIGYRPKAEPEEEPTALCEATVRAVADRIEMLGWPRAAEYARDHFLKPATRRDQIRLRLSAYIDNNGNLDQAVDEIMGVMES